jgi:hypothetical protein
MTNDDKIAKATFLGGITSVARADQSISWSLTVLGAGFALAVANAQTVKSAISPQALQCGGWLLFIAALFGVIAKSSALTIQATSETVEKINEEIQKIFKEENTKTLSVSFEKIDRTISREYWWPFSVMTRHGFKKGISDELYPYKHMMLWWNILALSSAVYTVLILAGVFVLAAGIKA